METLAGVTSRRCRGQGCYWYLVVEARGAVKDPRMCRTTPARKIYPVQSVNVTEGEKPWIKLKGFLFDSAAWLVWLMT